MPHMAARPTEQLEAAFEIFTKVSDSLDESYRILEAKVTDLTNELAEERSEKLRELAAKEQLANRLSALMAALPGGVLVLDKLERVVDTNPEADELLGSDVLGLSWTAVLETRFKPFVNRSADLELTNGKFVSLSERVLDGEGNQVVLLTDVTEAHAWQEWTHRESRLAALGEMSARLAHQLRTPLSSALLYVSHLNLGKADQVSRDELSHKITDRLRHLEELIDGMLGYVRGEEREKLNFSLFRLVDELENLLTGKLALKNGDLSICCGLNDSLISGDRQAILSALINITENAIEMIDQPSLQLIVTTSERTVEFSIHDNGPGIDPAVIKSIFDPFFTTRNGGTGLGLAIADITAREHGGFLTAENDPDGGAVFRFRIEKESAAATTGRLCANEIEFHNVLNTNH